MTDTTEKYVAEATMTKKQKTKDGVEAVNICIQFAYNADFEEFARMLHGRAFSDQYVKAKFANMRSEFARYWGSLDAANRCRFMDAAIARAEGHAKRAKTTSSTR